MNTESLQNNYSYGLQHFHMDVRETRSTGILLTTKQGDVVNISLNKGNSFTGDVYKTQRGDHDSAHQDFSMVSRAASKYSLTIHGELNEEELAAIESLTSKVTSIAKDFYSNEAVQSGKVAKLQDEMNGPIQEVSVRLEQVINQTFSLNKEAGRATHVENGTETVEAEDNTEIRNLGTLISTVVDTVFLNEVPKKIEKVDVMKTTLRELMQTFHDMTGEIIASSRKNSDSAEAVKEESSAQVEAEA